MKCHLILSFLIAISFGNVADAASIGIRPIGISPVYSIYIDGDGLDGAFDAIEFKAWTDPAGKFANNASGTTAAVPRLPGDLFTYQNRMLDADPVDFPGALGLTVSNLVNTPYELSFKASRSGGTITTAREPNGLFLANVYTPFLRYSSLDNPESVFAEVRLISGETTIAAYQLWAPGGGVPEPTGLLLSCLATLSFLVKRRSQRHRQSFG